MRDDGEGRQVAAEGEERAGDDRTLTPAARRALAEAAERRAARERADAEAEGAGEVGGRDGPEPVRYGDWEVKGIATDF